MRLYAFALSHFCEKARWALDWKGVPYQYVALLPGPHLAQIRRMAPGTSVPVLVDGAQAIQGSDRICDYLDTQHPENALTPAETAARAEAVEWEALLDRELGETTRRIIYFHCLPHARFVVPLFTQGGPWWGSAFYKAGGYAFVSRAIRKKYRVTEDNAARDVQRLRAVIHKVEQRLAQRNYLVGTEFTRADLTLAALGALLARPDNHPLEFPPLDVYPRALLDIVDGVSGSPVMERIRQLYRDHRSGPVASVQAVA